MPTGFNFKRHQQPLTEKEVLAGPRFLLCIIGTLCLARTCRSLQSLCHSRTLISSHNRCSLCRVLVAHQTALQYWSSRAPTSIYWFSRRLCTLDVQFTKGQQLRPAMGPLYVGQARYSWTWCPKSQCFVVKIVCWLRSSKVSGQVDRAVV